MSSPGPSQGELPRGVGRQCAGALLTRAAALAAILFLVATTAAAQLPLGAPKWSELSPQERQVLAPLAPEWDRMDAQRRLKWRGIAERYSRMSPDDQQRIQQQMRGWAQLTPQERTAARERYKNLRQLPPEKKDQVRQRWEQYQNLTPEQKKALAERAPARPNGRTPAPGMKPPPGEPRPSSR